MLFLTMSSQPKLKRVLSFHYVARHGFLNKYVDEEIMKMRTNSNSETTNFHSSFTFQDGNIIVVRLMIVGKKRTVQNTHLDILMLKIMFL